MLFDMLGEGAKKSDAAQDEMIDIYKDDGKDDNLNVAKDSSGGGMDITALIEKLTKGGKNKKGSSDMPDMGGMGDSFMA